MNPSIEKLLSFDEDHWDEWLVGFRQSEFNPDPEIALALLNDENDIDWFRFVCDRVEARRDLFTMTIAPTRNFKSWLTRAQLSTLSGPESWPLRLQILQSDIVEDDGYKRAVELYDEVRAVDDVDPAFLAEVETVTMRGALQHKDWKNALTLGQNATAKFIQSDRLDRANYVARRLAAPAAHLGDFKRAFQILDEACAAKGPLFGGDSRMISVHFENPLAAAIDELASTVTWADHSTPEYVRAVGGVAENASGGDANFLWEKFGTLAEALKEAKDPASEFEVVIRHAIQRDQAEVADRAMRIGLAACFEESWWYEYRGHVDDLLGLKSVRELFEKSPEEGIAEALDMFDFLDEKRRLTESDVGFAIIDLLLDYFIEHNDSEALEIQERVVASKKERWGECPAAWLEENNLGQILWQFGEKDRAREVVETSLQKQLDLEGESGRFVGRTRALLASFE